MIICSNDLEVRNAIINGYKEIGIKLVDNTGNAILGGMFMGYIGALLSQEKNATPGMQAILQESGYKYERTAFLPFKGNIMFYTFQNENTIKTNQHFEKSSVSWKVIDIED